MCVKFLIYNNIFILFFSDTISFDNNNIMAVIDFLPIDFSYVIFCIVYTMIANIYLMLKVGKARKQYGVKYPIMYSPTSHMFNCVQRAHQNFLELLPSFLILLLLVGFAYPRYAAFCGAIYITSRFSYAQGYYSGMPEKRTKGGYGVVGLFGLLFGIVYLGLRQCGCADAYLPF